MLFMKTITFFVLFCIVGLTTNTFSQPKIKFDTTLYDFGNVLEAYTLYATYKVTNIGTQPLIISNVQTGGGGLAPGVWSKSPILPGKSTEISLMYDSRGRVGPISKTARLYSNAINANQSNSKSVGGLSQKEQVLK